MVTIKEQMCKKCIWGQVDYDEKPSPVSSHQHWHGVILKLVNLNKSVCGNLIMLQMINIWAGKLMQPLRLAVSKGAKLQETNQIQ